MLRIEDIDKGRCRAEFVKAIKEDLAWLGLDWDEPVRRQSKHFDDYGEALKKLERRGLVYPCFCTRGEIAAEIERAGNAPHGQSRAGLSRHLPQPLGRRTAEADGQGHGLCAQARHGARGHHLRPVVLAGRASTGASRRSRSGSATSCWRARTPRRAITWRSPSTTTCRAITLVTRGADLFEATHVHRLLQALLGYATPEYQHHRLLTDSAGRRLAKRDGDITIRALRQANYTPAEVRGMTGFDG